MSSWVAQRTDLLRIAADNAAAWVVRGDIAEIVGDGTVYVFERSANVTDARFDTLHAGDRYDMAARRTIAR